VDRSGGPHACWPFTKSSVSRRTGYGNFWLNGKTVLAHRVAYALTYGPIPDFDEEGAKVEIDHVKDRGCTTRSCCNPAHLQAISKAENYRRTIPKPHEVRWGTRSELLQEVSSGGTARPADDGQPAAAADVPQHGLTQQEFDAMLATQGNRCAACRTDDPGNGGWRVDRDRACGHRPKRSCKKCVRGIVCGRCKTGIGNFRDDPEIIRQAAAYIVAARDADLDGAASVGDPAKRDRDADDDGQDGDGVDRRDFPEPLDDADDHDDDPDQDAPDPHVPHVPS
jgi:hypothetical protein